MAICSIKPNITVEKWANLEKSVRNYSLPEAEQKLLKSVSTDIINDNKKRLSTTQKKSFYIKLIESYTGLMFDLKNKKPIIIHNNGEVRILPKEPKLFDGEVITVSYTV